MGKRAQSFAAMAGVALMAGGGFVTAISSGASPLRAGLGFGLGFVCAEVALLREYLRERKEP